MGPRNMVLFTFMLSCDERRINGKAAVFSKPYDAITAGPATGDAELDLGRQG
jgi:hypothetical protein